MRNNKGQALLLILFSVGVIITVALSVVAKSVTDVSITKTDELSLRAFSAAEAGVEETLKTPVSVLPTNGTAASPVPVGSSPGTKYTAASSSFPAVRSEYLYPSELYAGDTATVWFSSHNSSNKLVCGLSANDCYRANNVDLCWGKVGAAIAPAISASIIYDDGSGNLKNATVAYDPNGSRTSSNNFKTSGINNNCSVGSTSFAYHTNLVFAPLGINGSSQIRMIIFRTYYNTSPTIIGMKATGGSIFPIQGRIIESTGASGDATRKVQVYALYPEVPNIFASAIYSPPGIIK